MLAGPVPLSAQGVFKCSVGGKTVYQSQPCPGQGKELEIPRGPTEQQVLEARRRADADKASAAEFHAASPPEHRTLPGAGKADCARLNRERADAFGRRNGAMQMTRRDGFDQSATVDREHTEIRRLEQQMVARGCSPT